MKSWLLGWQPCRGRFCVFSDQHSLCVPLHLPGTMKKIFTFWLFFYLKHVQDAICLVDM